MIFAKRARLDDGWAFDVRIDIKHSKIRTINTNTKARTADIRVDTLLPALSNLHSHSFQRAMAGMTEHRVAKKDSFWTWRDLMYRFIDRLTPEHIEAFAALTFMEMQEAGYAAVGEFHYIHHQNGGARYDTVSELSQRIFAGATQTGIGLTHLPVLYTYGGVGMAALNGGQLRFGNDLDQFERLVDSVKAGLIHMPGDTLVGIAPHSLRATSPDDLKQIIPNHMSGPVHIHISEQPKEVKDISNWLNARPVEWLLDNHPVDARWCLIHATHMTDKETRDMAVSGAVAGLCPITEANLGDGPFNGVKYLNAGGKFGLGSDSNVRISLTEELRILEYSQRLRDLARNVMIKGDGSVGEALYLGAAQGGAQALGRKTGHIAEGQLADLVAIDSSTPALCALSSNQLLDGLCFAAGDNIVTDLWSAGRHCVQDGRHIAKEAIIANYRIALTGLLEAI